MSENKFIGMVAATGMYGIWLEQTEGGKFIHCMEPNRGKRSVGPWPDIYRREVSQEEVETKWPYLFHLSSYKII